MSADCLTSATIWRDSECKMLSNTRAALLTRFDIVCPRVHSGAMLMACTMSSLGYLFWVLFSTSVIMALHS